MSSFFTGVVAWIYLVAGTLGEMIVFYLFPNNLLFEGVIGIIATVNALVAIIFSMELKEEPRAIQFFLFFPVALLSVLLLAMIFAYPRAG
jgi:predicted membrane channel-forming protein YqfA (hemolysin III family)